MHIGGVGTNHSVPLTTRVIDKPTRHKVCKDSVECSQLDASLIDQPTNFTLYDK